MPFNSLTPAQRKFLSTHTKSGKTLAQAAQNAPKDPLKAERTAWLANVSALRDRITAAPAALDTSKLRTALNKTERIFEAKFDPVPAEKALKTIQSAFEKASAASAGDSTKSLARLKSTRVKFAALLKLAFPDKKAIATKIDDLLKKAQGEIDTGAFDTADRAIDDAETIIAGAQVGVDAKAAKDLKPADLKVLMKTQDGQAQLDAIVDNLTDDVPPNVMISILEARFSLDRRLFQNTSDREASMFDKAKHGAMLDTDSPKLKKFYKKLMDKKAAEEKQAG